MIEFKTISSFIESLEKLLSFKRGIYSGIKEEIYNEFNGKTIEEIRSNRDMILLQDEAVIIKLRLPDKRTHLSKKDGYRLIYYVSKTLPLVVFLKIYPKRGPLQKINITIKELGELIIELQTDITNNTLKTYSFQ